MILSAETIIADESPSKGKLIRSVSMMSILNFQELDIGQSVLVRSLHDGLKWVHGTVLEQTGPVSYWLSDQV